jgi:hypothetical protein
MGSVRTITNRAKGRSKHAPLPASHERVGTGGEFKGNGMDTFR